MTLLSDPKRFCEGAELGHKSSIHSCTGFALLSPRKSCAFNLTYCKRLAESQVSCGGMVSPQLNALGSSGSGAVSEMGARVTT